jgi:prepilin-type N-terminal cleavage/methylation domain-containing protein
VNRRSRSGFTLMEVVLAVTIAGVLFGAMGTMIWQLARNQIFVWGHSERMEANVAVHAALREDLENAGAGLFSAHNWAGLHVVAAQNAAGDPRDTLVVMRAAGTPMINASRTCPSGETNCMVVKGDAAAQLVPGDLVVTGSRMTGARLLQVTAVSPPFTDACGADCVAEALSCTDQSVGVILDLIVTGSTWTLPGGQVQFSADPCPQLFFEDGSFCEETLSEQVVGSRLAASCQAVAGLQDAYSEVRFEERTAEPFGYPDPPLFTFVSGPRGLPQVRTQKVEFARYYVDDAQVLPTLVRQSGLTREGAFIPATPVAGNVFTFRVDVYHRGEASGFRGVDVLAEDLVRSQANSNFEQRATGASPTGAPEFDYLVSYRTIAGVSVSYVIESLVDEGVTRRVPMRIVVATPALLDGGAEASDR